MRNRLSDQHLKRNVNHASIEYCSGAQSPARSASTDTETATAVLMKYRKWSVDL